MRVVIAYMRRSGAFKTHKVKAGYDETLCHQRISNRKKWIAVDEYEWALFPCAQCKSKEK